MWLGRIGCRRGEYLRLTLMAECIELADIPRERLHDAARRADAETEWCGRWLELVDGPGAFIDGGPGAGGEPAHQWVIAALSR